jgi:hypothetical protein
MAAGRKELVDIEPAEMFGLEIGPLASPVVAKEAGRVLYVDHADAGELRDKYRRDPHMSTRLDSIVGVDRVIKPGHSLTETLRGDVPFDYIIASHVIEHIPDVVGWLDELAGLLKPGGVLSLVIPDKRYTFDINRAPTDISALVDAHLLAATRPSPAQMYDFFSRAINGVVDRTAVWAGTADYSGVVRSDYEDPDVAAYDFCQQMLATNDFVDVHCHVFTPASFLDILEKLVTLGLLRFEVSQLFPTEHDTLEFYVCLRRLPDGLDAGDEKERQRASISRVRRIIVDDEDQRRVGRGGPPPRTQEMVVSDLERRMILAKRSLLARVRTWQTNLGRKSGVGRK